MLKVRGEKTHSFLQSSEISHPISNKNLGVLESCSANFGLLRKYLRRFQNSVGVFSNFVGDNFYFVGGCFCFVGEKKQWIRTKHSANEAFLGFPRIKLHFNRIFLQHLRFSLLFLSPWHSCICLSLISYFYLRVKLARIKRKVSLNTSKNKLEIAHGDIPNGASFDNVERRSTYKESSWTISRVLCLIFIKRTRCPSFIWMCCHQHTLSFYPLMCARKHSDEPPWWHQFTWTFNFRGAQLVCRHTTGGLLPHLLTLASHNTCHYWPTTLRLRAEKWRLFSSARIRSHERLLIKKRNALCCPDFPRLP